MSDFDDFPDREIRKTASSVAGLLVIAAFCLVAVHFCGCVGRHVEADAAYTAEQLSCVDQANSREQADACRAAVRAKWADAGAKVFSQDGGAR